MGKQDTKLPQLAGEAEVWIEPDEPHHPLAGVIHALRTASARKLLVLAGDMPLVPDELLRELVNKAERRRRGRPLWWARRAAVRLLHARRAEGPAALRPVRPGHRHRRELGVVYIDWEDPDAVLSVNAPEDVLRAQALL